MKQKIHVLVCDQDAQSRDFILELLTAAGYVVHVFEGTESLDAMARHPVELAIIDVVDPDSDGFYVVDGLRLGGMRGPIVFMSETITANLKTEMSNFSNIRGILQKPVVPREILQKVGSILELQEV